MAEFEKFLTLYERSQAAPSRANYVEPPSDTTAQTKHCHTRWLPIRNRLLAGIA